MNVEVENTARALQDKPLFATRQWWCRFGLHTWLHWQKPVRTRRGAYDYVDQWRECGCCGLTQQRRLSKD